MTERQTLRLLKIVMLCGLSLLVLGHYLWSGLKLHETIDRKSVV